MSTIHDNIMALLRDPVTEEANLVSVTLPVKTLVNAAALLAQFGHISALTGDNAAAFEAAFDELLVGQAIFTGLHSTVEKGELDTWFTQNHQSAWNAETPSALSAMYGPDQNPPEHLYRHLCERYSVPAPA